MISQKYNYKSILPHKKINMKKNNIKLITAILIVALISLASIFYACNKDQIINNSEENLKKETGFIATNKDGALIQVDVFKDKNNNFHFMTKNALAIKDDGFSVIVSNDIDFKPLQFKNGDTIVVNIPDDGIYWLVLFGNEAPLKFEPVNNGKESSGSSGTVRIYCTCYEGTSLSNSCCEVHLLNTGVKACQPKNTTCGCTICQTNQTVTKGTTTTIIDGTSYLVKSNTITINGIIYE